MNFLDSTGLEHFYNKIKQKFIRSVNSQTPDQSGNVNITTVATAENLVSPDAQTSYDTYIYRTSGGSASLSSGEAELMYIDGNIDIQGRVYENFDIIATNNIKIEYDAAVWRSQISSDGTYVFNYVRPTSSSAVVSWTASGSWTYSGSAVTLSTYGLTASNVVDPSININISGAGIISATVVPDTFGAQVSGADGSYTFIYNNENTRWELDNIQVTLSDYGINITGTPQDQDSIYVSYIHGTINSSVTINYTAPVQGTIVVATPISFSATGFNQFDKNTMYVQNASISAGKVIQNSGTNLCYCRAKGGLTNGYVAYSSGGYIIDIGWCDAVPVIGSNIIQTGSSVTSEVSSISFDDDGYVVVVVSNMNDLCIHPKWSGSADTDYVAYVAPSVISIPTKDSSNQDLPTATYGMPKIGAVADRLNLESGTYVQKIGRLTNTSTSMNYVIGLNTAFDYDANYIYYVLPDQITYTVLVDPIYTVNDWGTEEFTGTTVAVSAQTLYGQNLRDKLRTDVLTISAQTPPLTSNQRQQVLRNIGISNIAYEDSLALRRSGATNTGAQIENGTYFYLDGTLKYAIATIAQNASFTSSNCETVTAGGLNNLKNSLLPNWEHIELYDDDVISINCAYNDTLKLAILSLKGNGSTPAQQPYIIDLPSKLIPIEQYSTGTRNGMNTLGVFSGKVTYDNRATGGAWDYCVLVYPTV